MTRNSNKTQQFMKELVSNQNRIHAYILYLIPHKTDAEDVLQETIVEMWNQYDKFTEGTNFLAWAVTIARYKVCSFRKKFKNSKLFFSEEVLDLVTSSSQPLGSEMDCQVEMLKKCMSRLPEKYKQYLLMRYEMNLPYRTIAAKVNISMQAVCKTFVRIHTQLAQCVEFNLEAEMRK